MPGLSCLFNEAGNKLDFQQTQKMFFITLKFGVFQLYKFFQAETDFRFKVSIRNATNVAQNQSKIIRKKYGNKSMEKSIKTCPSRKKNIPKYAQVLSVTTVGSEY